MQNWKSEPELLERFHVRQGEGASRRSEAIRKLISLSRCLSYVRKMPILQNHEGC